MSGPLEEEVAVVYRDQYGVPHITAQSEEAAWYALGYEQARDGLLWIQYACKAAKGELTWAAGVFKGVWNDIGVQAFGAHLGGLNATQLRNMFAPENPAIDANFYDNCIAFAAGADAYRQEVTTATLPGTPEYDLKIWLDSNRLPSSLVGFGGQSSLSWVHQHPITAVDIASQGAWTTAVMSMLAYLTGPQLVNSSGPSYADGGSPAGTPEVPPQLVGDPLAPEAPGRVLESIRQQLMALPGAPSAMLGSSSFCWTRLYCQEAATSYAGLLADPHHPVPFYGPDFPRSFQENPIHMWFAHVRVTPEGATQPSFDCFGHVPHAAATFQSFHNRSIAAGGTLGAPNFIDYFVLRLLEDPTGTTGEPDPSMQFYSYYHDTDMSSGGTPGGGVDPVDFRTITTQQITIKHWNNTPVHLDCWRAESFGVILPDLLAAREYVRTYGTMNPTAKPTLQDAVVYGERVDPGQPPPRFRAEVRPPQSPARMQYWDSPQGVPQAWTTSPMVVALRAPMDTAVHGDEMHWLLLRDFWEIAHAGSVVEAMSRTNGAGYLANVCFVDRGGATFSTQFSAIPQRGDDAALDAAEYTSLDKWMIYSLAAGPVPARHHDDRMFDWQFGAGGLSYLQYETSAPPTLGRFKPLTLRFVGGQGFPPQDWSDPTEPFAIENGGFVAACNDLIWGSSRKREQLVWIPDPRLQNPPQPLPFNDTVVTGNQLLAMTLDAGTVHQSFTFGFEAPGHQKFVVDQFTRQAEQIVRGWPEGLPPLTPAQMREFVVSPRLYNERSYAPPAASMTARPDLPTPVRQLRELVQHSTHVFSPIVAARKDLDFFDDLWGALYSGLWDNHSVQGVSGLTLKLRDLWINGNVPGHENEVFWYSDPSNVSTITWIEMPPEFPLIDFWWSGSELGRGFTAGDAAASSPPAVMPQNDWNDLTALVDLLETWEVGLPVADRYHNLPSSPGACLLQMMRMGYGGKDAYGRKWVRLKRGAVEHEGQGFLPLDPTGQPTGTGNLVLQTKRWGWLEGLAFPGFNHHSTLFRDPAFPGDLKPPYDALYDPVTNQVRTTLGPQDSNALVKFFLQVGGHFIEPAHNGGNPSRKLARYQRFGSNENTFLGTMPGEYPLTSALARVTVARALLDAGDFLGSPVPPLSQVFRARVYDHKNQAIWPPTGPDADCVGGGLRAVAWWEDADPLIGWEPDRGYQPKFLGLGGSYATLLTLFPDNQGDPESHFWCTPGVEAMGIDPARFNLHMNAFATNTLMRTHYSDFETNYVSVREHYYGY